MRPQTHQTTLASLASTLLLLPSLTHAISLDCANIIADRIKFDLSPLGGVHEISNFQDFDDFSVNTTYVLNICNTLKGAATREGVKCGTSRNSMPLSLPFVTMCVGDKLMISG